VDVGNRSLRIDISSSRRRSRDLANQTDNTASASPSGWRDWWMRPTFQTAYGTTSTVASTPAQRSRASWASPAGSEVQAQCHDRVSSDRAEACRVAIEPAGEAQRRFRWGGGLVDGASLRVRRDHRSDLGCHSTSSQRASTEKRRPCCRDGDVARRRGRRRPKRMRLPRSLASDRSAAARGAALPGPALKATRVSESFGRPRSPRWTPDAGLVVLGPISLE
jgi:hypothetical protein